MNIDKKLEALEKIRQVDAPPFLLTRIKLQIRNLDNPPSPVRWTWAFVASAVVIVTLNLSIIFSRNNTVKANAIETVVSSMHLSNTNSLYNE